MKTVRKVRILFETREVFAKRSRSEDHAVAMSDQTVCPFCNAALGIELPADSEGHELSALQQKPDFNHIDG
jgi:hypothetical protein